MKYCSHCAQPVTIKIPSGDNRLRFVCQSCGVIHYQNPKIVTGCIPTWQDKLLICKRAIEPRYGLWTLPAGFMENQETVPEAAMRETWEEARARVHQLSLFAMFNIPHLNQVYILFHANMVSADFAAGEESLEVKLIDLSDIPWQDLAFPVIRRTLELYTDLTVASGEKPYVEDIAPLQDHQPNQS